MPFEPFRFVHAAGLCLDHQLELGGVLPAEVIEVVEEATGTAYANIISLVIEQRADFLLLTGDSFNERDRSLRSEVILRDGFERLAEQDIRVFVQSGSTDPAVAWRAMSPLPNNVTPLLEQMGEPVAVIRDKKVIATVTGNVWGESDSAEQESANRSHRGPFAIGLFSDDDSHLASNSLSDHPNKGSGDETRPFSTDAGATAFDLTERLTRCQFDYLGLGGRGARRTISMMKAGIAHHPGWAQGIVSKQTGPHGCTLVDVDSQRQVRCSFVPTAAVRREDFEIRLDVETSRDRLVESLREELARRRVEETERVWLVRWTIRGEGSLFESMTCESYRSELMNEIESPTFLEAGRMYVHTFRTLPDVERLKSYRRDDRLGIDFFETLAVELADRDEFPAHLLEQAIPQSSPYRQRLHALVSVVEREVVDGAAYRLGANWFDRVPDEGRKT